MARRTPTDGAGKLLTAEEVAELLQVPRTWVYRESRTWERTRGGQGLPTVTLGRYRRYSWEAIERWINQQQGGGGQT